jgi:hypothetical protein
MAAKLAFYRNHSVTGENARYFHSSPISPPLSWVIESQT